MVRKRIVPHEFNAIARDVKTFQICEDDDSIQAGDELTFDEFDGWKYTGRHMQCRVTYVVRNCPECGLEDGYCILGIYPVSQSLWCDAHSIAPSYSGWFIVHVDDSHNPFCERVWGDDEVIPAEYEDGCWSTWIDGELYDLTDIVVHWMELPKAPEEGQTSDG